MPLSGVEHRERVLDGETDAGARRDGSCGVGSGPGSSPGRSRRLSTGSPIAT